MNVLLHGATNMSNFGDYIFAEIFYNALRDLGHEVSFFAHPRYGISDFFARNLGVNPNRDKYKEILKESECLVYISGGYFVEPRKPGFISELKHFNRYMRPARYFMKKGNPIYVLGVGAGPFRNRLFSIYARKVLNYATVVTVRDEESKLYCNEFGINNDIHVTSDTALLINEYLANKKAEIPKFIIKEGAKMLLFHIDSNEEVKTMISNMFVPAVIRFLKDNPEYQLFLAADGIKNEALYEEYKIMFSEINPIVLKYENPWVLARQIERADLIITTKLHMGIVGSAFGCSVVSFPYVPQKTVRFYKQIGEPSRCVPLSEANADLIYDKLVFFKDKKIKVPEEIKEKAKLNLDYLPKS